MEHICEVQIRSVINVFEKENDKDIISPDITIFVLNKRLKEIAKQHIKSVVGCMHPGKAVHDVSIFFDDIARDIIDIPLLLQQHARPQHNGWIGGCWNYPDIDTIDHDDMSRDRKLVGDWLLNEAARSPVLKELDVKYGLNNIWQDMDQVVELWLTLRMGCFVYNTSIIIPNIYHEFYHSITEDLLNLDDPDAADRVALFSNKYTSDWNSLTPPSLHFTHPVSNQKASIVHKCTIYDGYVQEEKNCHKQFSPSSNILNAFYLLVQRFLIDKGHDYVSKRPCVLFSHIATTPNTIDDATNTALQQLRGGMRLRYSLQRR